MSDEKDWRELDKTVASIGSEVYAARMNTSIIRCDDPFHDHDSLEEARACAAQLLADDEDDEIDHRAESHDNRDCEECQKQWELQQEARAQ